MSDDEELYDLMKSEYNRQRNGLELIASENFTSKAVMCTLGSVLTNKYSEGLPGKRYYGGNEIIDKIESLCISRALDVFSLDPDEWGVNVQAYSGSIANLAVFNAVLNPHDRIMGLDLPAGGHLTHGFYTATRKVSISSIFYESLPYGVDETGNIDYVGLERDAKKFKPKLIICGYSAHSRDLNYREFRRIADINKSYLLCDMAHISGLVAAKEYNNPFEFCDIVTSTTHKTLAGPRSGLIFYKNEYSTKINNSVFPAIQGGPHEHQIAAVATQLNAVKSDKFKGYIKQVKLNADTMAKCFIKKGYIICTGGTDNHMILCDLKNKGISGSKVESICDFVDISINKNCIPGDISALNPSGIRIGTSALTSRGLKQFDFVKIVDYIDRVISIGTSIDIKDKNEFINSFATNSQLLLLKSEVNSFACQFDFY